MTNTLNPILGLVSLYKETTSEWDGWSIFYSYICFTITLFALVRYSFITCLSNRQSVTNFHIQFGIGLLNSILRFCCHIDDGFVALFSQSSEPEPMTENGSAVATDSQTPATSMPADTAQVTTNSATMSPDTTPPVPTKTEPMSENGSAVATDSKTSVTSMQADTAQVTTNSATMSPDTTPSVPTTQAPTPVPATQSTLTPADTSPATTTVQPIESTVTQVTRTPVSPFPAMNPATSPETMTTAVSPIQATSIPTETPNTATPAEVRTSLFHKSRLFCASGQLIFPLISKISQIIYI